MYLLYLDDSGSVQNPSDRHIVLAGVAVFERQPHWFSEKLNAIAGRIWPESPESLEFRGTDILGGKRHWRGVGKQDRIDAYREALDIIGQSRQVAVFCRSRTQGCGLARRSDGICLRGDLQPV
jgi:hypothetical protein